MVTDRNPVPAWSDVIAKKDAEIAELKRRLEIRPDSPYDGIYCRDETIRLLEQQIERLRNMLYDVERQAHVDMSR